MKAYNYLKPQVQCLNFLHCQWKFYGRRDWKMFLLFILLFILFRFTGIFVKFVIVKYVAIMRKNTSWDIEGFFPIVGVSQFSCHGVC